MFLQSPVNTSNKLNQFFRRCFFIEITIMPILKILPSNQQYFSMGSKMNKTVIEWCDFTWNPVTGCKHPCRDVYCYNTKKSTSPLNRFGAKYRENGKVVSEKDWKSRETGENHVALQGEVYPYGYDPTIYFYRLDQPKKVKEPAKIFVADTGDLFGNWVPAEWVSSVLSVVKECPWHTFQFLTKNPRKLLAYDFPENAWVGTSINSDRDVERVNILKKVKAPVRYLSVEPLLGELTFNLTGIEWVILGAMTGKNPVVPEIAWIEGVLTSAGKNNIPVFMKDNVERYYQSAEGLPKEFPVL